MLPPVSLEQQAVISQLSVSNVIVDSVAGSGKTTTVIHVALNDSRRSMLLLTYNANLKIDTRKKIKQYGIKNMEVHSYHSFCRTHFAPDCHTDQGISCFLNKAKGVPCRFDYDIIAIDEVQDMTPLYFHVVCFIQKHNKKDCKILLIGDKNQSIYSFNCADQRFLTMGHTVFDFSPHEFAHLKLQTSYRITHEMSNFINKCVLNEERMSATKDGEKVRYIVCNVFDNENDHGDDSDPLIEVKSYLKKYDYQDIYILAPSVKTKTTPARQLANRLTALGHPIFVPNTDDEKMDEDVMKGKIVFSTFHQAKGCQRKVVLVFGFDASYMKYYARNALPHKCPNPLYVAITRGQERLTVFHHYRNDFLPFVKREHLEHHTILLEYERLCVRHCDEITPDIPTSVTDILRFLPSHVLDEAQRYVEYDIVQDKDEEFIDIPRKTRQGKLVENVSDITGIAIPSYLNYLYNGDCELLHVCEDDTDTDIENPEKLLKLANIYCSKMNGYNFKLAQITDYSWLSGENLSKCIERMKCYIKKVAQFEIQYIEEPNEFQYNRKLLGIVDCLQEDKEVWEFKCVSSLTHENKLQLALYAYLVETKERKHKCRSDKLCKEYFLFNLLDNKIVTLKASYKNLCHMTKYLIEERFLNDVSKSDKDFEKECKAIARKVFSLA